MEEYSAFRGTIIVMNPRNGDVLALANHPSIDPNSFLDIADPNLRVNPAINETYEPGTLMHVLTVASALDHGIVSEFWTYNDEGYLEVGGRDIWNPHFQSHGATDVSSILVNSLDIGAATIALGDGYGTLLQYDARFWLGAGNRRRLVCRGAR